MTQVDTPSASQPEQLTPSSAGTGQIPDPTGLESTEGEKPKQDNVAADNPKDTQATLTKTTNPKVTEATYNLETIRKDLVRDKENELTSLLNNLRGAELKTTQLVDMRRSKNTFLKTVVV